MRLLNERDGLALGICNGFQALIKLGLVPNGEITGQDENGKNVYETTSRTVTSRDLKGMLESYKNRERTSIKDALAKPPVHGTNPQPLRTGDVQR